MPSQRIALVDALRGFALFGILQINLQAWLVGLDPFALLLRDNDAMIDHVAWALTSFFITAKFYPIFGFLFGYSFSLQWDRMIGRGLDASALLKRRYVFLLGLGVLHGLLLFFGDILTIYALAAFVLLGAAGLKAAPLRHILLVWLVVAMAVIVVLTLAAYQAAAAGAPHTLVLQLPSYLERARMYLGLQPLQIALFLPQVVVFFLCGAYAARIGLLRHPGLHHKLWQQLSRIGILIGMPVSAVFTLTKWLSGALGIHYPWLEAIGTLSNYLCALMSPAIVAAFVALGLRLHRSSLMASLYRAMANAGRLALSNYIAQSVLMLVLLEWAGLGRHLSVASLAGLGLAIYLVQLWGSGWILRHFNSGPLEWLWRRFTYRRSLFPD